MTDLDPERWRRLEELFMAAEGRPRSEREAFLAGACAGDDDLRAGVEELLAAGEGSEARIERAIRGTFELAAGAGEASSANPDRIGPYRILRELGRGGMGTVYLAERDDEHYRQRVAVKVVRRGPDSDELRRRLRQERQILANLDHPHIARLLDGGNTGDGTPYFVAEYVEGEPIDRYCDRRGLSVSERLELFREVCTAVQYAHRNLVIHRDLKPSNLLVTAEGSPKLLDFGIAKLLDPETLDAETPHAVATVTGLSRLTPEYASPEQVRGRPLTTAADVYSLGVLLYELLTGRHPYAVDRGRQLELLKAICEVEPERPSAAVLRSAEVPESAGVDRIEPSPEAVSRPGEVSRSRGFSRWPQGRPEKLARRLRGDLDNIVLKAIRKQPERRYVSVDQLAEDVRRHLAGLPVTARADSFGYRFAKFLRRHRAPVTAVAAALLAIVALVSFYTVQLAGERDRALREERESAQVVGFLRELFENADPGRSQGEEITARELLDQGAERIETALEGQPRVQAELMDLMGTIYTRLGLYDGADPLLESSLGSRRRIYGNEHSQVAASLHHRGEWLRETGRYDPARRVLRQALEMRERLLGAEHPQVADSLTALADLLFVRGEYVGAEELFRRALAIRRGLHGEEHPDVATSLSDLGATLYELGRLEDAEPLLRGALQLRQRLFGDRHPDVATTLIALAAVRLARQDGEAAERLYRRALEIWRQLYGPAHPQVAHTLNNLGELMRRRGAYGEAELLLREALEITRRTQGEEHPSFARRLANLADTLRGGGDLEAAEPLYRQALGIARRTLGDDDWVVVSIWLMLGDVLVARDALEDAERCFRESLRARRTNPPDQPWKLSTPMVRLGRVLLARDDPAAAREVLREAVEILRRERPGEQRTLEAEALLEDAERRKRGG